MQEIILDISESFGKLCGLKKIFFRILLDATGIYTCSFEEGVLESKVQNEENELGPTNLVERLKKDLFSYFSGKEVYFDYPLSERLTFTPFQQRVLEETRKIPYGETLSYKELAERVGTKGYRAVGQALKRNPLPVIIPCHRVTGEKSLGGYAGNRIHLKKALLKLEKAKN